MEVAEAQRTELWMNVGNSLGHDRLLAPWEGRKKKAFWHSKTGSHAGRYRSRAWSALAEGGRGVSCPGEVNAELYLHLCGDRDGIFSG